jgi:hypothetical protein
MTPELKKSVTKIMDMFTGADGGISYVHFKVLLEATEQKALTGDKAAEQIIALVFCFERLIDVSNKVANKAFDKPG